MKKGSITYNKRIKLKSVQDLVTLLSLGGAVFDPYGDLLIKVSKGFITKKIEAIPIEFGLVKGSSAFGGFFAAKTEKGLEAVLTLRFRSTEKGTYIEWECLGKSYWKVCKEILKIFEKGLKKFNPEKCLSPKDTVQAKNDRPQVPYSLTEAYSSLLDGMAEITLTRALLKYPLIWRFNSKVGVIQDLERFLKMLSLRLDRGKYIVLTSGNKWRFILGINTETKEYTPSFISWTTNERLLGERAIKKFLKCNSKETVKVMIFKIPENIVIH